MELIGAVMLCCAFFFLGVVASRSEKVICDRIYALGKLVVHIRSSILATRIPLSQIFGGYEDKVLYECGFLSCINNPVSTEDYAKRWQKAVKLLLLPKDAEVSALGVGAELGRCDLKTQIEQLVYLEKVLEDCLKEQRRTLEGKQKVYKSVSLLIGVVISILLL